MAGKSPSTEDSVHCTLDIFRAAAARAGTAGAVLNLREASITSAPDKIDYTTLHGRIVQSANLFSRLGVGRDDAVAVILPLLPETMFALWGAEAAGIAMPLNPLLSVDHMEHLLRAVGCKVLVALGPDGEADIWEKAQALQARVPTLCALVQVSGVPQPGALSFSDECSREESNVLSFKTPRADDVAAYFHTGGTTGAPKLARHSHRNQIHVARAAAIAFDYRPGERLFCGMPLFHVAGSLLLVLAGAVAGSEVVLLTPSGLRNRDVVTKFWALVERYKPGVTAGSPTSLVGLAAVPVGAADLSSVRMWFVGGAPLPGEVADSFERATGIPVREGYGMTESGGLIAVTPVRSPRKHGSTGKPVEGVEVRIIDPEADPDSAEPRCVGQSGMVIARGANVFPGYVDRSMDDGVLTRDGWLVTGDLGRLDAQGYLYLNGRAKDVIIRGSHNIDPAGIEEVAARHPAVLHCAAVGQADPYAGEVPVLYVSLKPELQVDPEALREFVAQGVAEQPARPKYVYVVDEIPLTGVGKIFKPALRIDAARRAFSQVLAPLQEEVGPIRVDAQLVQEQGLVVSIMTGLQGATPEIESRARALLAGFNATFVFGSQPRRDV